MGTENGCRFDPPLESGMKKGDSFCASLQALSTEPGFASGPSGNAGSGSFPNVEMNRRLEVVEMVIGCLPTSGSCTNCRSLDQDFTLLSEEHVDQFCLQKLKRNILPSIRKGEESAFNNKKVPRKKLPLSECSKPLKPRPPLTAPCMKKIRRNMSKEIAPWVGNSLLDTSCGAFPQSLEQFPRHPRAQHHFPCGAIGTQCGFAIDSTEENNLSRSQDGCKGAGGKGAQQSHRAVPEGPAEGKALPNQRSGKDGWSRRRLRNELREGAKLPPVQSISNLSFSRSFTFSFFELPQHLSKQYRAQRTLPLKQVHS
ncbi:uncharacterized protein [Scyliorhinus torazame]|uniref:uncharacterized protein n=1 Tax=Scyliorhinus torazame TaxID=75743 RepID=UPI003B5B8956